MLSSTGVAPNVLLVVMDTARADGFEPYGASIGSTPTIAQMASMGAFCRESYSTANWTVPGHVSLFSGLMPKTAGLAQVEGGDPAACRAAISPLRSRWLPEVLRSAGYATAGISANLWIAPYSGFNLGFDRFEAIRTERQRPLDDRRWRGRLRWVAEATLAKADDGAREAEAILQRWIEEGPRHPFFWFVNLVECHSPYLPPKPFNDLIFMERMRAANEAQRYLNMGSIWRVNLGGEAPPPPVLARMHHLYRRSIAAMDAWLSRVLDRLELSGLLDDTVVIATSDHGENLGEAGLLGHAFSLDNRLLRVPLVAASPEFPMKETMSLADLPAAIADTVGLVDHPWQVRTVPQGMVAAQMGGLTSRDDPRAAMAVREWGLPEAALKRMTTSATTALEGSTKLVRGEDGDLLFHLDQDPLEERPIAVNGQLGQAERSRVDSLRAAIQAAEEESVHYAYQQDTAFQSLGPGERADIEKRMRLLGYL